MIVARKFRLSSSLGGWEGSDGKDLKRCKECGMGGWLTTVFGNVSKGWRECSRLTAMNV